MPALRRALASAAAALLVILTFALLSNTAVRAATTGAHDPATYYAGTDGLTGSALEAKLHSIITTHTKLSYDQLWTALPVTDADPSNPANIIDFYSGDSLPAAAMCNHSGSCLVSGQEQWNREHTWAKSHGDFGTANGPGTDLFHMRPEYADVNSIRNNNDFDNGGSPIARCPLCKGDSDSFEPRDAIKGDLARGLFYMAVSYDGGDGYPDLQLNDFTCNANSKAPLLGKLSTLIQWSLQDPPDATEEARNNLIDADYQHNRNPFIDHPEWVQAIWGNGVGQGPACGSTSGGSTGSTGTATATPSGGTGGTGGTGSGGDPAQGLVISEAYINGGSSGSTYLNKFVELYNPLDSAADLSPYSLEYFAPTAKADTPSGFSAFGAGATIPAHGYYVVQLPSNASSSTAPDTGYGAALPKVDATSTINPGTKGGTLVLASSTTKVGLDDDSVVDTLGWGTGIGYETKAASGNSVTLSYQRSFDESDTDDNSVDFQALPPTPGKAVDGSDGPGALQPSETATADPTTDPTATASATATDSATADPTATATATATEIATESPIGSVTADPSGTPTATPTAGDSSSAPATGGPSGSPSPSTAPSGSPTVSASARPTETGGPSTGTSGGPSPTTGGGSAVQQGTPTLTLAKAPTSAKRGKAVLHLGTVADGTRVTVTLTKGGRHRTVHAVVHHGTAVVRLPKLAKGTWKVSAAYGGTTRHVGTVKAKAAKARHRH